MIEPYDDLLPAIKAAQATSSLVTKLKNRMSCPDLPISDGDSDSRHCRPNIIDSAIFSSSLLLDQNPFTWDYY